MTRKILYSAAAIFTLFATYIIYVTFINPKSPKDISQYINEKSKLNIEVVYSRPSKRDRLIFGDKKEKALVPYGEYWRLGANAATTFEVNTDINFGGKNISAGKYRLYAIPEKDHWSIVLNSEPDKFGYYEPNFDKDVLRVKVASALLLNSIEQFTIDFVEQDSLPALRMRWDKTSVSIPIE